jgi:hypothetical protein
MLPVFPYIFLYIKLSYNNKAMEAITNQQGKKEEKTAHA